MDIMPKADSKNAFVSGPVVKSDTSPAIVFNIICPLLPTNTSNTIRTSWGDNGNWSSKHDVDGLPSKTVRAKRTMAALTLGLLINLSISMDIELVTSSSVAAKVDIVPTSSTNWITLPLAPLPTLEPFQKTQNCILFAFLFYKIIDTAQIYIIYISY